MKKGKSKSCGCVISFGEEKIASILSKYNIPFVTQYHFNDLMSSSGVYLRFDFYVNNQYVIEYDGIQHYEYRDSGWNTKENFESTIHNDILKNVINILNCKYKIEELKL